jgi:hypothetical protein
MTQSELERKIKLHELWLEGKAKGQRADFSGANLRGANFFGVNLEYAIMQDANLKGANLVCANLEVANLKGTNLEDANLRFANLKGADLELSDLRNADFQGANLQFSNLQHVEFTSTRMQCAYLEGANIDYSSWTLWCGSLDVKLDNKIAAQLAYHFCRLDCSDEDVIKSQNAIRHLANSFHRASSCGEIKEKEITHGSK